jgi:lipopolysaccharide export system permease protein
MTILHRYIAKTVIQATLLVLLVMMALTFLIVFLDEMKDVGTGDYGFWQAFIHVLLEFPRSLYQFYPMLLLMGAVIGLGILSSQQELVVMRTAGFSIRRIAVAVVSGALVLILAGTAVGEWYVPKAHHLGQIRKQSEQSGGQAVSTQAGVWIHEGNNFLRISRVVGLKHLEDVTRYQFDAHHHLLAAYFVKALDWRDGKWQLHDVQKTTFGANATQSEHLAESSWDIALSATLLNVGVIEPSEMALPTLWEHAKYLQHNGLQASDFQWEFWKRVFQPLTTLVIILLAIPFVLGSSRSVTMGWRVLFGIVFGFGFYMLNAFLGEFSIVFQFSPLLAASIPTVLFALLGYVLALRLRK